MVVAEFIVVVVAILSTSMYTAKEKDDNMITMNWEKMKNNSGLGSTIC